MLVNSLAFPNVVVNAMRTHAVTGFAGVPSTYALLLQRSNLTTSELPALRYATQAGGAMPPSRIREWLTGMAAGGALVSPLNAADTAIAHRARSLGVVQRPAAAASG